MPPGHIRAQEQRRRRRRRRRRMRKQHLNIYCFMQLICPLYEKKRTSAASWFIGLAQEGRYYGW